MPFVCPGMSIAKRAEKASFWGKYRIQILELSFVS